LLLDFDAIEEPAGVGASGVQEHVLRRRGQDVLGQVREAATAMDQVAGPLNLNSEVE
jgi:hypothetical protein